MNEEYIKLIRIYVLIVMDYLTYVVIVYVVGIVLYCMVIYVVMCLHMSKLEKPLIEIAQSDD